MIEDYNGVSKRYYEQPEITYFAGACVKASSSPVIMMKASEMATKIYAGACIHTWMLFGAET